MEDKKNKEELNNNGIVRMIRGYFYEMSCVIQECYRTHLIFIPVTKVIKGFNEIKAFLLKS
ncbi:MAG: hypothetical protein FWJ34_12340 [Geminocystis sp. GBBB08]|nr:hypothetical protein [Geminocystis sp. GBBB08]